LESHSGSSAAEEDEKDEEDEEEPRRSETERVEAFLMAAKDESGERESEGTKGGCDDDGKASREEKR
jgi:hypothetical protein